MYSYAWHPVGMSGMDMRARRRDRLATWVLRERKRLRWSVETAARQAGINRITWERVERAQKVQDTTYDAVDRAFHLKAGGCEAIMADREPERLPEVEEVTAHVTDEDVEKLVAEMREQGVQIDALTDEDRRLVAAYAKARTDRNGTQGNGDDTNRRAG